jgi:hypothetical protein
MSYENLVMQNVVASIEATDDIRKRFISFVRGLIERSGDFHFKLSGRKCKIAAHKSRFVDDGGGGCAGQIVIETESDRPQERHIRFKLKTREGGDGARLTLTFNPSQLLANDDVAPTLSLDDDAPPEFPASSQSVTAKLLGLGFDILDDLYVAKHKRRLINFRPPFTDEDIRLERVSWDASIPASNPRKFLLFLLLLFEPVFTANDDRRPLKLANLLSLKMSCSFDLRSGDLTRVTLTRLQGERRKIFSIEFSELESSAAEEQEETDLKIPRRARSLRLRVTAHPTGIVQLIQAGNLGTLDQEDDQSNEADVGNENNYEDAPDGNARNNRDVWALSRATEVLAVAFHRDLTRDFH